MQKSLFILLSLLLIGAVCFFIFRKSLKVGQAYNGFILDSKETVINNGRKDTLFTFHHIKTNAKVLYVKNNDPHKFFAIGFSTPIENSTGVQHILEHSVLSSSKKYQDNDLFFNLAKQTPATFINAYTAGDKVLYLFQTINEKDFANLMDIYLNAALNPELKKETFEKEGWALNVDGQGNLYYNGVVYNEMKNAYSDDTYYWYNGSMKALFKGQEFESGGNPEFIPNLTYEDFLNYYKKTHTPANSFTVVYGDGDTFKDLKKLDAEFKSYSKNRPVKATEFKMLAEPLKLEISYPASRQETNYKIVYTYAMKWDATADKQLEVLEFLLSEYEDAVLKKEIINKGLAVDVQIHKETIGTNAVLSIYFDGVKKENVEKLQKVYDKVMNDHAKNGFEKSAEKAALSSEKFQLNVEDRFFLTELIINLVNANIYEQDPKKLLKNNEIFNEFESKMKGDFGKNLVKKVITENKSMVIAVLKPDSKMQDNFAKKVAQKLAKIKATMSKKQLENLRIETLKREEVAISKNAIFPVLKMKDWKNTPSIAAPEILKIGDVEVLNHKQNLPLSKSIFAFDLLSIDVKKLPVVALYRLLADKMDTNISNDKFVLKQYSELGNIIRSELYISPAKDKVNLKYFVKISSFANAQDKGYELLGDLLFSQKYDAKKMKNIIAREVESIEQSYRQNGEPVFTKYSDFYIYKDNLSGMGYLNYLKNLLKNWDKNYPELVKSLQEINKEIFVQNNLIIDFVGANLDKKSMKNFVEKLPKALDKKVSHKFNIEKKSEARIIPATNYRNYLICNVDVKSKPYFEFLNDFITYSYLYPEVRIKGGAYGSRLKIYNNGEALFYSYADPNLAKTFDAYLGTSKFLKDFDMPKDKLEALKIKTLIKYVSPRTEFENAEIYLRNYIDGVMPIDLKKEYEIIKEMSVEDIKNLSKEFEKCLKNNEKASFGPDVQIQKNKELFDIIK